MKRKIQTALIVLIFIVLSGCASISSPVGQGLFYTDINAPILVADSDVSFKHGLSIGKSSCRNILGLFCVGDGSIHAAVADGHITKIHYIDKRVTSSFIFITEQEVRVYGDGE